MRPKRSGTSLFAISHYQRVFHIPEHTEIGRRAHMFIAFIWIAARIQLKQRMWKSNFKFIIISERKKEYNFLSRIFYFRI